MALKILKIIIGFVIGVLAVSFSAILVMYFTNFLAKHLHGAIYILLFVCLVLPFEVLCLGVAFLVPAAISQSKAVNNTIAIMAIISGIVNIFHFRVHNTIPDTSFVPSWAWVMIQVVLIFYSFQTITPEKSAV